MEGIKNKKVCDTVQSSANQKNTTSSLYQDEGQKASNYVEKRLSELVQYKVKVENIQAIVDTLDGKAGSGYILEKIKQELESRRDNHEKLEKTEWRCFNKKGSSEEMTRLNTLLKEKGILREDLILIFKCLEINPSCSDNGIPEKWELFVNNILDKAQQAALRSALLMHARVFIYGSGHGKSIFAKSLRNAGYGVWEPGNSYRNNGDDIPEWSGLVAFRISDQEWGYIPRLLEDALSHPEIIQQWVNQDTRAF